MRLQSLRYGALALLFAFPAFAQNAGQAPAQQRIRGVIESYNAPTLTVKSADGKVVSVMVPADLKIMANAKTSLTDIKPGDFVGSAASVGPDGKLYAEEVHVFAESQRGAGEGHRPMGPDANRANTNGTVAAIAAPERSMTNGTVSAVSGSDNVTMKVTYKGGEQEIIVKPDTPIITNVVADAGLLKPGAMVAVVAVPTDGGLVARGVTAEKDGVLPR